MPINQSFKNWELLTGEPDGHMHFQHTSSGEEVVLKDDGTVDAPKVDTDEINTAKYPKDGDVQDAIDAVAPNGSVILRPGLTYTYGSPIRLKEGVTLYYNGARAEPSADHDMLQIEPGSRAIRPIHDTRGISGYSEHSIKFSSEYKGGANESYGIHRDCGVWGGYTRMAKDDGFGVQWESDGNTTSPGVTFCDVIGHDIEGGFVGLDFFSFNGNSAFVNVNKYLFGTMHNTKKFIRFRNTGTTGEDVRGNLVAADIQPNSANAQFGVKWDGESNLADNGFIGSISDASNFSKTAFRVLSSVAETNYIDVRNSNIAHNEVYDPNDNGYYMSRAGHLDLPRYDSSEITPPKNTMYYDTNSGSVIYKNNSATEITLG